MLSSMLEIKGTSNMFMRSHLNKKFATLTLIRVLVTATSGPDDLNSQPQRISINIILNLI